MKLLAGRSLLGLLLLTLVSVPALILADDILVTWGTNLIQSGGRQSLFVPSRTYITKSEITSVALSTSTGYQHQTITLVEGGRNVSIWSNEIREEFLLTEELTVGTRNLKESYKIDLSNLASLLPVNIKHMEMRPADGLYLTTRGELYRFTNGLDVPARILPSEFHLAPGSTFVDAVFKELECAGMTCVALGNSGRFYISSWNRGELFNPLFPEGTLYQNFYELDLRMLDRLDITHWDFTSSRFVFVNHSSEIYEVGVVGSSVTLVPVLNMIGIFSSGFPTDIAFVCTQYAQTVVVTRSLAVYYWDAGFSQNPSPSPLAENFLFEQRTRFNNELVQIGGTVDAWFFLMSNGKIFTVALSSMELRRDTSTKFGENLERSAKLEADEKFTHDQNSKRDQRPKRELSDDAGPSHGNQFTLSMLQAFVAEVFLGETIPSTHKIVSLVMNPESPGAGVLVKPRSSAEAAVAIEKFDEPQDTSGSILISWGRVSPMLGTGWSGHSTGLPEFAPMEPVLLSHLSKNLRNITKVATGGPVIVALTQDGHVMTWGCTVQSFEACWHATPMTASSGFQTSDFSDLPPLSVAVPIDRLLLDNQTVVDVAVSQTVTALLLEDKRVLYWATLADTRPSKRRASEKSLQEKRHAKDSAAAHVTPPTLSARFLFGSYDKVYAGKDTILAIDSTSNTVMALDVPNDINHVILSDVEVVHIDVDSEYFAAAFVVRNLSSNNLHLLYYGEILGLSCLSGQMWPGTGSFRVCDATSSLPFAVSTIRQLLVRDGTNAMMIMTDDQVYYAGGPTYYSYRDTNFNYRPLPQTLPVPISSISKLAILQDRLAILTTTGDLYTTFDPYSIEDMTSSSASFSGNFTLMKSDYVIDSIPTHQRAWQTASFIAFGTKKPATSLIPPSPPTTDISSFFFGTNYFCQFGLENCASSSVAEVTETDPYHPVNSPSASQISIGFVASLVDGSVPNGFQMTHRGQGQTKQINRVLRWGGPKRSIGGSTRYQQITYQEAPFYEDEQELLAETVTMVKTVSAGSSHVTLYSNCTLAVQWYSADGPTGSVLPTRNTWPTAGVVGPPIAISDNSYGYRALREFYVSNHYPMSQMISYGACGGPGAPVAEDLQCREKSSYGLIGQNGAAIHCTIRSGSRLFSVELAADGSVQCEHGLLGPYDECTRNVSRLTINIYGLVEIDTTSSQSAFSGLTVVQYRLGFQHAVALTSDGTVVSWGDNSYSQLGLGGPTDEIPLAPIPSAVKRDHKATRMSSNENANAFGSTASSKRSASGISFNLGIPSRTALPAYVDSGRKVFAAGYSSFLLTKDHRVFGWGLNYFGVLGRGIDARELLHSPVPERVVLPFAAIADAECASYSCYALYESGAIFSWGNNGGGLLGRETDVPNSISAALPAEAKKMKFKDPRKKPKEIVVGPGTVLVRGKDEQTPPPACPGEKPTEGNFTCVDGKWTTGGDLSISRTGGGTPSLILQTPVVVLGNLTVPAGESIQIVIDDFSLFNDPEKPYISVSGCFQGGGEIQFMFEPRAWIKFKNEGNGKKLTTIESSCQMQEPGTQIIQQVDAPATCQKASSKSHGTERPNSKFGLQSTFTINSSRCTRWWMILLCVIAAVIIIVAVVAIIYRLKKTKSNQASSQRVRSTSVRSK